MKEIKLFLAFIFSSTYISAGTYTTNLNLYKPARGDTNYVTPFSVGMDTLDAAIPDKRTTKTAVFDSTVTINTPLTVNSSATISGAVSIGSTATFNGAFYLPSGAGINKVLISDISGYGSWTTLTPGGDIFAAATQTFSGANTFTSSVTVGNSGSYSTVMDYSKALIGSWSAVAISSFTAASNFSFTNYNSSYTCKVFIAFTQNTSAGYPYLQFNGDGGNNYYYAIQAYRQDGNRQDEGSNGAQPHMHLLGSGIAIGAGYGYEAELTIVALPPNRTTTKVRGFGGWQYNVGAYDTITFNLDNKWMGEPKRFTITTTAGTMTGEAKVLCLIQGAAF